MNTMEEFANNPDYQDIIFLHCSGYKSNKVAPQQLLRRI